MNSDQGMSLLRWGLTIAGTYATSRGWADDQTSVAIATGLATLLPAVWGIFAHSTTQKIKAVAADPKVAKVTMVDPIEGAKIGADKVR